VVAEVLGGFGSGRDSENKRNPGDSSGVPGASSASITTADGSGLRMVIDEPHNSLVFVGSAQSFKAVYQMLQQIDVPAKQVLLEVTVADITLEANTQLGIEWQFTSSNGDLDGVGGTLGGLGLGGGGFSYAAFDDVGNIRARINALATSGDAQILSSPKLLAVDNEEARIQVGTQIAVVTSENTDQTVNGIIRSFNYVDTGVILSFTPTVMAGGQVRLIVSQEVSQPGPSLNNTPAINTRSVQTTMIARSGSTVMIGGLISTTDTVSEERVPFLGSIPGIGALFRSRNVVDNSTEMIVLITPHIIESSSQLEALTEAFREKIDW
jgi:general secretion pathway protein D